MSDGAVFAITPREGKGSSETAPLALKNSHRRRQWDFNSPHTILYRFVKKPYIMYRERKMRFRGQHSRCPDKYHIRTIPPVIRRMC